METIRLLIEIEQFNGQGKKVTTESLARPLNISQQTASRRLRDLESLGLIERKPRGRGHDIRVTERGRSELKEINAKISSILSNRRRIQLTGHLTSGDGEGRYYMSQSEYVRPIKDFTGFHPFGGTLNLVISEREVHLIDSIKRSSKNIGEFRKGDRTFGGILISRCRVGKVPGAVIFPMRTHHKDNILEIVAEENLRKRLSLSDGDPVTIEVDHEV